MKKATQIILKGLDEIMPYERNPRKNDNAVDKVAESIKEFGFKSPIIIDKSGVIVCGHTRYKAAKKLGLETVPTIIADDLTPYQIAAYRLADNKSSEFADWDLELLDQELMALDEMFDMETFGFELDVDDIEIDESELEEDRYTDKALIPQYEIRGDNPDLSALYDTSKADALIEEINNADIDNDKKNFLIEAAKRHTVFNYSKIAEYYAHQDKVMQELMERSALVIIDYDDAIAYGYANLKKRIEKQREKDCEG